jgi:hypothetical protein
VQDWKQLQDDLRKQEEPDTGWQLIADARYWFEKGDRKMAIILLNSALEEFVQIFIERELKDVIPSKSLERIQRQAHAYLLSDWVRPLCEMRSINVDEVEFQSVKDVLTLRNEIAHPQRRKAGGPSKQSNLHALSELEFFNLTRHSISFICKILHQKAPKTPPPLIGDSADGT